MSEQALPERPDAGQLRRLAKELRAAARAGDPGAVQRLRQHVDDDPATVRLSAAQLVVAREHGFASWPRLMEHLEARRLGLQPVLSGLAPMRAVAAGVLDDGQMVVLAGRVISIASDAQDGGRLRLTVVPAIGAAPGEALINASGDSSCILNERVRHFAESRWRFEAPAQDAAMRTFLEKRGYRYVIGGNPHVELPAYEFPFLQASSLRINECLVAAALNGHIPYTDSIVHDSLLRLKVNRALVEVDKQPELKKQLSIDVTLRFPMQSLALEVLDHLIPDEMLNQISVSDLLAYRSRNAKLLARFHSYLEVLAADIGDVTPGDEYVKRVRRTVSSKVVPELTKARDDLVSSYEDAFGGIVTSSAVAVSSTVSATVFSGLDLWQVLLAGALAEGAVLVTKAPAELLKVWKGMCASSRSPMAYIAGMSGQR